MYIRCAVCQAATWLESLEPGVAQLSARCQQCDQEYSLLAAGELGTNAEEQYQRARQFAEYNKIDLPSAYSVMLGIMDLDQARSARDTRVRQTSEVATFTEEQPEEPLPYDEGFHLAVMEGFLTAEQAANRGSRKALAVRLSQRHGMPLERAYLVADNRLSLYEARKGQRAEAPAAASPPANRSHVALMLGFAAVIVAAVGLQGWRAWHTPSGPPPPAAVTRDAPAERPSEARAKAIAKDPLARAMASTNVQTDAEGHVVRVVGPDPLAVLIAFCNTGSMHGRAEPVELARPVPDFGGARLGIFRDTEETGSLQAIRITEDRKSRRWVAGNGSAPIRFAPPPDFPPDHPRVPVHVQ